MKLQKKLKLVFSYLPLDRFTWLFVHSLWVWELLVDPANCARSDMLSRILFAFSFETTLLQLSSFLAESKLQEFSDEISSAIRPQRISITTTTKLYFTPELKENKNLKCYIKAKMIGVLATRDNLRVKNARQPVKRKDILHVSVRDTKQTNIDTHKKIEINKVKS